MQGTIESVEARVMMSATPATTLAQKHALKKLGSDLVAIYFKRNIPTDAISTVAGDLTSVAAAAHKPDPAVLKKLKTDAKAVFAQKTVGVIGLTTLAVDVQSVLTSAGVADTLATQTANDMKLVLSTSTITKGDIKLVFNDLKSLVTKL